jgi:hypothetical protein
MLMPKINSAGFSLLILAGCATQPPHGTAPGLFMGIVHGFLVPFSLLGSTFWPVRVYAYPNSGFGYDLGFASGFGLLLLVTILLSIARIGGLITREGDH